MERSRRERELPLIDYCSRCHIREAETKRRLVTSVGTLGLPEPACLGCARKADDEREREARGCISVDRAVRRYRASLGSGKSETLQAAAGLPEIPTGTLTEAARAA